MLRDLIENLIWAKEDGSKKDIRNAYADLIRVGVDKVSADLMASAVKSGAVDGERLEEMSVKLVEPEQEEDKNENEEILDSGEIVAQVLKTTERYKCDICGQSISFLDPAFTGKLEVEDRENGPVKEYILCSGCITRDEVKQRFPYVTINAERQHEEGE